MLERYSYHKSCGLLKHTVLVTLWAYAILCISVSPAVSGHYLSLESGFKDAQDPQAVYWQVQAPVELRRRSNSPERTALLDRAIRRKFWEIAYAHENNGGEGIYNFAWIMSLRQIASGFPVHGTVDTAVSKPAAPRGRMKGDGVGQNDSENNALPREEWYDQLETRLHEDPPTGRFWTRQLLATDLGVSYDAIRNGLRFLGLSRSSRLYVRQKKEPPKGEVEARRDRVEKRFQQSPPRGYRLWSIPLLAKDLNLSYETVRRDLRARELLESDRLDVQERPPKGEVEARRDRVEKRFQQMVSKSKKRSIVQHLADELKMDLVTVRNDLVARKLMLSDQQKVQKKKKSSKRDKIKVRRERLKNKLPKENPPIGKLWTISLLAQAFGEETMTVRNDLEVLGSSYSDRLQVRVQKRSLLKLVEGHAELFTGNPRFERAWQVFSDNVLPLYMGRPKGVSISLGGIREELTEILERSLDLQPIQLEPFFRLRVPWAIAHYRQGKTSTLSQALDNALAERQSLNRNAGTVRRGVQEGDGIGDLTDITSAQGEHDKVYILPPINK